MRLILKKEIQDLLSEVETKIQEKVTECNSLNESLSEATVKLNDIQGKSAILSSTVLSFFGGKVKAGQCPLEAAIDIINKETKKKEKPAAKKATASPAA